MKSKKGAGLLEENTVGSLAALIGLVILFAGLGILIYRALANPETEAAKTAINLVNAKINALQSGQATKPLIRGIKTDNSWYLVGWSKDELGGPENDQCFLKSCICICQFKPTVVGDLKIDDKNRLAQSCSDTKTGFCRKIDVDKINIIEYDAQAETAALPTEDATGNSNRLPVTIGQEEKISPAIKFNNDGSFLEIRIEKKENEIIISETTSDYINFIANKK